MRILIKNIDTIATFDKDNRELKNGYIIVENNIIKEIGTYLKQEMGFERIIDEKGKLMLPGFVNTHHHLYQTLFRNVRGAQNTKLFDWLITLYEKWKYIDEEAVFVSAAIGILEMMKTGVTTTTDHLYLFPYSNNQIFEKEIEAAKLLKVRFHPTRGSMSLSKKDGGLPPDSVVQAEEEILKESERLINIYHDNKPYSMLRIALAPCSPFSVTPGLMRETLELAKKKNVLLHTHLAETKDEEEFCLEKFNKRPVDYMEELGWLNDKVWFAHLVHLSSEDIEKLSKNNVGMAHCPTSNMRLGSGIAPVSIMKDKNIRIGLAVDGSASNDTSNMLFEIRNTLLLQRVKYKADSITPGEVLKMATSGGASVLKQDDYIGSIEEGKAADIIMFDLNTLELSGCLNDPVSSIVMCNPIQVDFSMINGEILIENKEFVFINPEEFVKKQNEISKKILEKLD